MPTTTPHVVLVHGGFVDGSGWQGVYDRLTKDGHTVTVVQTPRSALMATSPRQSKRSTPTTARQSSSAIRTEAPSSPKPAITPP